MMWTNRIANKLPPLLAASTLDLPSTLPEPSQSWLGLMPQQHPRFSPIAKGDRVRVCQGIFRGVEGTVVGHRSEGRLIIAVDLLQQGVTIELDATMVQSLEARFGFRG